MHRQFAVALAHAALTQPLRRSRRSAVAHVSVRPTSPKSAALAHRRSVSAPRCAPGGNPLKSAELAHRRSVSAALLGGNSPSTAPRRSAVALVPVRPSSQLRPGPRRSDVALVPVRPTSPTRRSLPAIG